MSEQRQKIIYWHRQDLRLKDNPALTHGAQHGEVIPVYIKNDKLWENLYVGEAQKWWLHHSLSELEKQYHQHKIKLILRSSGEVKKILHDLIKQTGANMLVWNKCYDPASLESDQELKAYFEEHDIEVANDFNSTLLNEPDSIKNQAGDYFKVFTPYWKNSLQKINLDEVLPVPTLHRANIDLESDSLASWNLLPTKPDWAGQFGEYWQPGEEGAREKLKQFLQKGKIYQYNNARDEPGKDGTSCLSPHLKWGEITPKQIWYAVHKIAEKYEHDKNIDRYLAEIGWREFSYYLLYHFPDLPKKAFNSRFDHFPWEDNDKFLIAWQKGKTGYPMVDAGMRQLWHSGWMHNRVRMIVGSFLTKHLLIAWQKGAEWFHYTLLDGDVASNSASWQWIGGCGADAAPYFRIFNPILQGEKFDSKGDYIRKWVPELAKLPNEYIHAPWEASEEVLAKYGVELGKNYPKPIVDHSKARQRALEAYNQIK